VPFTCNVHRYAAAEAEAGHGESDTRNRLWGEADASRLREEVAAKANRLREEAKAHRAKTSHLHHLHHAEASETSELLHRAHAARTFNNIHRAYRPSRVGNGGRERG
jgi:hypothetical protein